MSDTQRRTRFLLMFTSLSWDHGHIYHDLRPWSQEKDQVITKTLVFILHFSLQRDEVHSWAFYNQPISSDLLSLFWCVKVEARFARESSLIYFLWEGQPSYLAVENREVSQQIILRLSDKFLIYIKIKSGPSREPWGTPALILAQDKH